MVGYSLPQLSAYNFKFYLILKKERKFKNFKIVSDKEVILFYLDSILKLKS